MGRLLFYMADHFNLVVFLFILLKVGTFFWGKGLTVFILK